MEDAKAKSSGIQVRSVKFIEDKNVLELDDGGEMAKGCVFGDHNKRQSFIKLFVISCTYTLQIPYFRNLFHLKPMEAQTPSQYQNYYRAHCHKSCEPCLNKFVNKVITCKKCVVPHSFEVQKSCRREMNLHISDVVPIKNFEEFHSIVAEASQYMIEKKKVNNTSLNAKLITVMLQVQY